MTPYMASCSVEIGGFWDLPQLSELSCSLAYVSSLHEGYLVFIDIDSVASGYNTWLPRDLGHARSPMEAVFVAHFSHYSSHVLVILSLQIIV